MIYTEAVEMCPDCMSENTYLNWDVQKQGYIAKCKHCNKQIFLCDECLHAEDNPNQECNWHETEFGGECFRGKIYEEEK